MWTPGTRVVSAGAPNTKAPRWECARGVRVHGHRTTEAEEQGGRWQPKLRRVPGGPDWEGLGTPLQQWLGLCLQMGGRAVGML